MKIIRPPVYLLLLFSLIFSSACNNHQNKNKQAEKEKSTLNIAVAANMQFATQEISKAFTNKTGIVCNLVISSSGKLTAQIKEGAPYDVFISADMKYPNELFTTGFAAEQPKIYAYGKLVMWSMINGIKPSVDMLKNAAVIHIAIADPKTAPYGEAAIEALKYYGIYESIKDKLVYGESISQTNQFIISKAAEVGFTAKSVVLSPEMKGKGQWIDMDKASYEPIAQGVVIIKQDKLSGKTIRNSFIIIYFQQMPAKFLRILAMQ